MGQLYAIFRNTLLEAIRQPAYGLVLSICCALIAASPLSAAQAYTFGTGSDVSRSSERLIANLGLSTILLSGLILAVFSATSVISREIEEKTALTVLSKRVSRTAFLFAKYLGVSVAITLATTSATMFLLVFMRVGVGIGHHDAADHGVIIASIGIGLASVIYATLRNYFRGRSWVGSFSISFFFCMAFVFALYAILDGEYNLLIGPGRPGVFAAYDLDVAKAGLLTLESILVLTGIAVAASTRLGVGGSFAICALFFLAGLTIDYFVHAYSEYAVVQAVATLVPDLQPFGMAEPLAREKPIPLNYVVTTTLYAGCYIFATLFCAAFLFQKREIA